MTFHCKILLKLFAYCIKSNVQKMTKMTFIHFKQKHIKKSYTIARKWKYND